MPHTFKWARDLRDGLVAEIAAIESGKRLIFEGGANVSARALERLRLRLGQVDALIAAFDETKRP